MLLVPCPSSVLIVPVKLQVMQNKVWKNKLDHFNTEMWINPCPEQEAE